MTSAQREPGGAPCRNVSNGPVLALLPSPLLGPTVWRPVAEVLRARGWDALSCPVAGRTPQEVLDCFAAALTAGRDVALVPHSNAGAYVPALCSRLPVVATVFVDAVLAPASGTVPLAPPALLADLRGRTDGHGDLPVWTSWWEDADVAPLFPDATIRALVEADQRRLPLSYFESSLPVPQGWDQRPGAYLAFGDTYADERAAAARRGWPVRTIQGRHLHMLIDPVGVADELVRLMNTVCPGRSSGP